VGLQYENKLGKRKGRLEVVVNREKSGRKGLREEAREGLKRGKPNWKVKGKENLNVR
jgi:hypothetical protein